MTGIAPHSWLLFLGIVSGVLAVLLSGKKLGHFSPWGKPLIIALLAAVSGVLLWNFFREPALPANGGCLWDISPTSFSYWCTPYPTEPGAPANTASGGDLSFYSVILTLLTGMVFVTAYKVQKELKEKKDEIERRISDIKADTDQRRILQSRLELYLINERVLTEDDLDGEEKSFRSALASYYAAPGIESVLEYLDFLDEGYTGQFRLLDSEYDYLELLKDFFEKSPKKDTGPDQKGNDVDRVSQVRGLLRRR